MIRSASFVLFAVLLTALPLRAQPETNLSATLYHSGWPERVQSASPDSLPSPRSVMFRSAMVPGWGQIVNRQAWKVPLVYGLLGGLTGYSIHLTRRYHGYRAAYYNLNPESPDDFRFGPTPDYISPTANLESLRSSRDLLRNRRDLIYVTIALAYGLNIVDAYVFAHMRSFDVSEDLSMRTTIKPGLTPIATPGLTLSIELFRK